MILLGSQDSSFRAAVLPERGGILARLTCGDSSYIYGDPALLQSGDRPRGGMPILFPICGKLREDTYCIDGKAYTMPIHGPVQNLCWEVAQKDGEMEEGPFKWYRRVKLQVRDNAETRVQYPYHFLLEAEYTIQKDGLRTELTVHNHSDEIMPYSVGFHPYFQISDLKNIKVYLPGGQVGMDADGEAAPEVFAFPWSGQHEYRAIFSGVHGKVRVVDAALERELEIRFSKGLSYLLLWSRPEKHFLCVEPWSAPPDAFHTHPDALYDLKPGEKRTEYIDIKSCGGRT